MLSFGGGELELTTAIDQIPMSQPSSRYIFVITSMLAFGGLASCEKLSAPAPIANSASSQGDGVSADAALGELMRFGESIAAEIGIPTLKFVSATNGVDPATTNPDESLQWSIYYLKFDTGQSVELQLTGNPGSQQLSPEDQLRQDRWTAHICTQALRKIMAEHAIDAVYATFGKQGMPVATCQQMDK